MMQKIKKKLDSFLGKVLIFIMGMMVLNVLWQVFTRFAVKNPSSFTEELARYLLIWLGILGSAYAAGQKMHLAIDLLSVKLKGKSKIFLEIFIELAILFFSFFVMVVGGLRLVFITFSLNQISAALQIPLGYVYLVIPISGALICFYSITFIDKYFNDLKHISD